MHTPLLVFEFLGTTELLVIAVVALILFGPRKLPEIGRSVGRSLAEFKRASDDFKRTWEYEVEIEQRKPASEEPAPGVRNDDVSASTVLPPAGVAADDFNSGNAQPYTAEQTVARGAAEPDAASTEYADEGAWDVATGRAKSSAPRADEEDEINAS